MSSSPLLLALGLAAASAALTAAPPGPRHHPWPSTAALQIPPDGTGWGDWDNAWGAFGDSTTYGGWDWLEEGTPGEAPVSAYPWRWWQDSLWPRPRGSANPCAPGK